MTRQMAHPASHPAQNGIRAGEAISQHSGVSTGAQDMIHMINHCCSLPLHVHPNTLTELPVGGEQSRFQCVRKGYGFVSMIGLDEYLIGSDS